MSSRDWSTARTYGRFMQDLHLLQEATQSDLSQDDILFVLNVNEVQADAQPKKVTVSGLGTVIGGGGGATALSGLSDVDIVTTPPTNGQALVYASGTGEWIPGDAGAAAAGSANEIQYNDGSSGLAASADLTWDDTAKELGVGGDINLDDGGTYSTTVQTVTPTANRTISFPDATGTVALVAGSNQAVQYNSAGANAGDSGLLYDATTGSLTVGGKTVTTDAPVINLNQTWNNAATTFTGLKLNVTNTASAAGSSLLDLQLNGSSAFKFDGANRRFYLGSNNYAYFDVSADGYVVSITNRYAGGSGFSFRTDLIIKGINSGILLGGDTYTPGIRLGTFASPPNHVKHLNAGNVTSTMWLFGKYGGAYAASTGYINGTGVSVWCGYGAQPTDANANGGNAGNFDVWLNAGGAGAGTGVAGANGRLRVMNDDTDTEVFGVEQSGVVQIGGERLIANLPSSPTAGMITRVTDGDSGLTFGNTVVNSGAGATPYLVWYNGTNWTIIGA